MSEWEEYRLGNIVQISSGGTPSKSNPDFWNGDIPWISASSMEGYFYSNSNLKITSSGLENGSRLASKNSILLLVRGSILHQKIQVGIATKDVAFNQDVKCLMPNEKIVDPWFLLLWFKSREKFLLSKIESTGIGAGKIDTDVLRNLNIRIPPSNERKHLNEFFRHITDKIELNRNMNKTLGQMAQSLFRSWFVDFDPVIDNALVAGNEVPDELEFKAEKRTSVDESKKLINTNPELARLFPSSFEYSEQIAKWIPEGWEVKKLAECVEVKYGKDHKKLGDGNIPCFGSGGIMRYVDTPLYDEESVLIPRKGTLDNVMYVDEPFWSVDTMFYTRILIKNFEKYFYYCMLQHNFTEMNVGSAVPSMTTKVLNAMSLIVPSENVLSFFNRDLNGIYRRKKANGRQIETLSEMRDRLLPNLISGKLKIKKNHTELDNNSKTINRNATA